MRSANMFLPSVAEFKVWRWIGTVFDGMDVGVLHILQITCMVSPREPVCWTFLCAVFQLFDQTCHLAVCHTSLPCSRRRKEGAVKVRACAQGCFSHSSSLKVSWATGVSLSLTGDQQAERRMITASIAVIQPSTHLNELLAEKPLIVPTAFCRAEILISV